MLAQKNQENKDIWASIARMEAELNAYKAFIQFMAKESAVEQCALVDQAEELETISN